jgi:hypothetical protein
LVLRLLSLEECASLIVGVMIGVGNNGAVMRFRMRLNNSGKAGQILVGFPAMAHNAYGGGMHGWKGRVGSFLFHVLH